MIINVGSVNPIKIEAVKEVVLEYDFLKGAVIKGFKAASNVSSQPKSIDETATGARNRARHIFQDCDYSVGLESGLFCIQEIGLKRWMNFTVCAIYDGKHYAVGFSPAFQIPQAMATLILKEGCEMDEAVHKMGFSKNKRVGYGEGFIAILTKGAITRKEYMKPAIQMALAQIQSKELYWK